MLGPLPKLYRVVVAAAALLVFVVGGTWAAFVIPYPILLSVGASVGLGVGAAAAYLLIHQAHAAAEPQRVRARRLR